MKKGCNSCLPHQPNQKITFTLQAMIMDLNCLSEDDFFVDETFVQELLSVENIVEDIKKRSQHQRNGETYFSGCCFGIGSYF
ncbi:hypothetical protein QW060_25750 [Myroides ceti]|uniref:Uncharacterized protein n=1 Tax=Paenimyroides ceti TaxID=395087 RepID=A0ABT8D2X6_9FLAO|nr:hypothetical protein [Paenimyroides ceti]MDN3710258.1 hypothetical protein [Paenimyroides ceti]